MRDFTNMTVIPPTRFVAVDGEGYHCDTFAVADIKGTVRTIPGDRILAVHWFGEHKHGQVEGFGAAEGISDRAQVELYLAPWLKARAKAKREAADGLLRRRQQDDERMASMSAAVESVKTELTNLDAELKAAAPERANQVMAQISQSRLIFDRINANMAQARKGAVTDGQISEAEATAMAAENEASA